MVTCGTSQLTWPQLIRPCPGECETSGAGSGTRGPAKRKNGALAQRIFRPKTALKPPRTGQKLPSIYLVPGQCDLPWRYVCPEMGRSRGQFALKTSAERPGSKGVLTRNNAKKTRFCETVLGCIRRVSSHPENRGFEVSGKPPRRYRRRASPLVPTRVRVLTTPAIPSVPPCGPVTIRCEIRRPAGTNAENFWPRGFVSFYSLGSSLRAS